MPRPTPVIDVFAGPGGLCEGFSKYSVNGNPTFKTALSIEMDEYAHQTLTLRAFFRQFSEADRPEAYYEHLRGERTLDELYAAYPEQAQRAQAECWRTELGKTELGTVRQRIDAGLDGARDWVLIGGPPCQPFSLAGRSRNKAGTMHSGDKEKRHTLYQEYLRMHYGKIA